MLSQTPRLPSLAGLKTFCVVARHLSMQQAASELHVTPTAISHQIRSLEEELGAKLFERRPRSLALTSEGEDLYRVASRAFSDLSAGIDALRKTTAKHVITVAATPLFSMKWLVPRLADFRQLHPGTDLLIRSVLISPDINLNELDCDLAIRYGVPSGATSSFSADALFEVVMEPVCSPQVWNLFPSKVCEPLAAAPLLHDEFTEDDRWVPGWGEFFSRVLPGHDLPAGGLRYSNAYMTMESAIAGHGWALAITQLAEQDIRAGRLVRPLGLSMPAGGHFQLYTRKASALKHGVRTFAAWVRERVLADMREEIKSSATAQMVGLVEGPA